MNTRDKNIVEGVGAKETKNSRDGYHLNHKHWQLYKQQTPSMDGVLLQCALGMVLGDATISKRYREAHIKFEQGYKQKDFLHHLFQLFKRYCFMEHPGVRLEKHGPRAGQVKSYYFRTFSHSTFSALHQPFYPGGKKSVDGDFISQNITPRALAYWGMSDGSLQKGGREFILHSQCFTLEENGLLSGIINEKFQLKSRVIPHKEKYSVIFFPGKDGTRLRHLIQPYTIPSMAYKLPK